LLGITTIHPTCASNHLLQFGPLDGFSKTIRFLFLIWLTYAE